MKVTHIVIDTNVWISALKSTRGASYLLVSLIGKGRFETHISIPLVIEYEDVAKRLLTELRLTEEDIETLLDYICRASHQHDVFYLWRPFLNDPKDDMVLELAVAGSCDYIVTYNLNDFRGVEQFGIQAIQPKAYLKIIGVL